MSKIWTIQTISSKLDNDQIAKIIFILQNVFLVGWLISTSNLQLNELHPNSFGPFHFLPMIYWFSLLGTVFTTFFVITLNGKVHLKFYHILLLGLMTMGTLSIIEPYGRGYPDAYVNVNLGELIFQHGTISYGSNYPKVYPTFYLFMGIFQSISNFSFSIVRAFPLMLEILYLFGIAYLVNSIAKYFNITTTDKKLMIICSFVKIYLLPRI